MAFKSERRLAEAIEQCKIKKIISLVKCGHNIYVKNELGQNFLIFVLMQQQQHQDDPLVIKKHHQLFRFLLVNYNLDIHSFDQYHKNTFNWATNLNCTEEALYLLKLFPGDIDILARDQSGSCSLHYAVEHGNETLVHAIVNYLLRYRLRFDIKDGHGNTPESLAEKLGYLSIANYLAQACRSTVFMSREIPSAKLTPISNKSKRAIHRNSNTTISSTMTTTSSSSLILDSSENFLATETKITDAKRLDEWKKVATLRRPKKSTIAKKPCNILNSIPEITIQSFSSRSELKMPKINHTKQLFSQSEQMLRLIEPQLSSSYRPPAAPLHQYSILTGTSHQRTSLTQRKLSHASSHRRSSILSIRKRDSEISQTSNSALQDMHNRFSVPAFYKSHRPSIVVTN